MDQTIQILKSKLIESRKINSSIVQKGQSVLACSETAQRRIQDLEGEITRLNNEINSRNSKIPELMRRLNESEKQNSSLVQKNQKVMLWSDSVQRKYKDLRAEISVLNSEINSLNVKLEASRKSNQNSSDVQTEQTITPWSETAQKRTPSFREVVLEEETARLKNEIILLNSKITEKSNSKIIQRSQSTNTERSKSKQTERSRSWQSKRVLAMKKGIHKINGSKILNHFRNHYYSGRKFGINRESISALILILEAHPSKTER